MRVFRVCGVQMASDRGSVEANVSKALEMAHSAADEGARLICLPELFATEYFPMEISEEPYAWAQSVDGELIESFRDFARERRCFVVVPWFEVAAPGVYYNSAAVLGPEGHVVGVHRKTHIPALKSREKLYFRPGERLDVFDLGQCVLGVMTCYERSFPEVARILVLKGAELVVVPSSTWRSRMWAEELQTRALENCVFVLAVNKTGKEKAGELCGGSLVVGPDGDVLARLGKEEGLLLYDLDLDRVREARIRYPVFGDRRPDLYGPLLWSSGVERGR